MRAILQNDANGNRGWEAESGKRKAEGETRTNAVVAAAVSAAQYDAQDRMTNYGSAVYQYNEAGTLTNKTIGGQATTYRYDALGSLLSVSSLADPSGRLGQAATSVVQYSVDPLGRRIAKRVNGVMTRGYVYKDFLNPVAEVDNDDNVVSVFIYGARRHVPDYLVKNGVTYRIISDHLGSVRLVVSNVDGSIAQRIDYDEWGRVVLDTNPGFQPFGFAGGLYDPDTGLVRFGFRDYDAETGRWLSKDPILFGGGDPNYYVYCHNDPLNWIDPLGLGEERPQTKTCVGKDRVLAGNPATIGTPGGWTGDSVGIIPVEGGTAAVAPEQWGGKGNLRPHLGKIHGITGGGQEFDGISDVIGGESDDPKYRNAREKLLARNPGVLLIELPSGHDEGVVDIHLEIPAELDCPEGTAEQ